jgi:WD40 repeat protein
MPRLNPFAGGRTKLTRLWEGAIDGHVVSLSWSHALGLIAAASADGPIALFDAKTGQLRANLLGHGFGTSCIAFSPDGQHLASAGQDGKVRVWNPATGRQVKEMPGGAAWVDRVAWSALPTGAGSEALLASSAGKKLRLWNRNGDMLREFPDHATTIADMQWKPGEPILASTCYGKLLLWDIHHQEPVQSFSWQGSMLTLAWSPDAKYIAAGAQDCTVHFWVLATGEDLQMAGYPRKVRELAWDATSRYLATGGAPVSCVWDFFGKGPAGTEPTQLEAHKDFISCLAYQHRGDLLASGGADGQVVLWRPGTQRGAISIARHDAPITQLAWSADDQRLAITTEAGGVILYSV